MNKTNMARSTLVVLLMLGVSACSSQRDNLTDELRAYGMQKKQAKCMSGEMDDRLNKKEMKSVNRVLHTGRNAGDARPSEVIRAIKNLDNAYVIETAVKSSIGCTLLN